MPFAISASSPVVPNVKIPLAHMGASAVLSRTSSAQSAEGPSGSLTSEAAFSDTDSLLDSLDLEAQMAQERLHRRTRQLRWESAPLHNLSAQAALARQTVQRGGQRVGEHLSNQGCSYIVGLIVIGLPALIIFLVAKYSDQVEETPTQAKVTAAAILGAQMTTKLPKA